MNLPSFFEDDSKKINFKEAVDFYMSWTISCADKKYKNANKKVYNCARSILAKLLYFEHANGLSFSNIEVKKRFKNIDLWIELTVNEQEYALIIENKIDAKVHKDQLTQYQKIVEKHYNNKPQIIIEYVLLCPIPDLCKKNNSLHIATDFNYLSLKDISDVLKLKKTENQLFDEFWFNWIMKGK
ncbi:PD-(D/E)XK nuclease family protein [Cellulophaga baltica]|uniref:PD-(D/E)XK nuclease family protein n=1 Tax=Cellulophaga TaxID=104264 RepID=UPI001C076FDE|nr:MULTISPECIES: PD-(D/E)XK nuclease family protein [Cellulophaga]MBU2997335.1 PD-(D/E)XK nuclease family protein [Cellulophaga baltica]MDO6768733.1 PD-(D/E)XK nuclease family protein [Cellulophaga sp. 1_MG-2023]